MVQYQKPLYPRLQLTEICQHRVVPRKFFKNGAPYCKKYIVLLLTSLLNEFLKLMLINKPIKCECFTFMLINKPVERVFNAY